MQNQIDILTYIQIYGMAYIISIIGAFITEFRYSSINKKRIHLGYIFIPPIIIAFIMPVIGSYFKINLPLYIFLVFILGIWSNYIYLNVTDSKFFYIVIKVMLRIIPKVSNISKDTINDIRKEIGEDDHKVNNGGD